MNTKYVTLLSLGLVAGLTSGFVLGFKTRQRIEVNTSQNWFYYEFSIKGHPTDFQNQFESAFSEYKHICVHPSSDLIKQYNKRAILYTSYFSGTPYYLAAIYGPPEVFDYLRNSKYIKQLSALEQDE